jgi:hypothetical protein
MEREEIYFCSEPPRQRTLKNMKKVSTITRKSNPLKTQIKKKNRVKLSSEQLKKRENLSSKLREVR